MRGLARLLRRNPTDAERALWDALTKDRRFAGLGFKRQTPVGPHITDFVSFPLRLVIDIVPETETEEAAETRAHKRGWLAERDYRVLELRRSDVERDVAVRARRGRGCGIRAPIVRERSAARLDLGDRLFHQVVHGAADLLVGCATPLASRSLRTFLNTSSSPASSKSAITTSLA